MLSHVEFSSSAFPAYENEEEEVNPGRYGKRAAEYIANTLREKGEPVEDIFAEDWGWTVPINNPEFRLWIGVGNYEEYEDGFLCFIEPHTPYLRKWFRKITTEERIGNLRQTLDAVLQENGEIRNIKWWTHDEFNNSVA